MTTLEKIIAPPVSTVKRIPGSGDSQASMSDDPTAEISFSSSEQKFVEKKKKKTPEERKRELEERKRELEARKRELEEKKRQMNAAIGNGPFAPIIACPISTVKRIPSSGDSQESMSDDPTAEISFSSSESSRKPKVSIFKRRTVWEKRETPISKKQEFVPEKEHQPKSQTVPENNNDTESIANEEIYTDLLVPESPESSLSGPSVEMQEQLVEEEACGESNQDDLELWTKQRDYWVDMVLKTSVQLGPKHIQTAESLMELGNAYLLCEDSLEAGKAYLSALKIYQSIYGDYNLATARALDKLGLAACKTKENLDLALVALTDALEIRYTVLGQDHVDSIDTLNNIAGVRLNMKDFEKAAGDYQAVFSYREKIFGRNHASVAVTALKLACILDDVLGRPQEARRFFLIALDIYETLGLKNSPYAVESQRRVSPSKVQFDL